jgi:hypothetical protein
VKKQYIVAGGQGKENCSLLHTGGKENKGREEAIAPIFHSKSLTQ